jgi:hypothetical protein
MGRDIRCTRQAALERGMAKAAVVIYLGDGAGWV